MGEKVHGIRSINRSYKIDREMLRIVWERRSQRTYIYMNHGHEVMWGNDGRAWGGGE